MESFWAVLGQLTFGGADQMGKRSPFLRAAGEKNGNRLFIYNFFFRLCFFVFFSDKEKAAFQGVWRQIFQISGRRDGELKGNQGYIMGTSWELQPPII
jgi:hypothetical protein